MPVPFGGMPINFGRAIPSGSHCGTYRSFGGGGGNVNISIKNYNAGGGCCGTGNIFGAPYMGGAYYGGCCCGGGSGISDKAALTALGIGAGIGLLASPLGGPILKGIGNAASWTWNKAIKPAATWTFNNILKPVGQGIAWCGKQVGNAFAYVGKGIANLVTGKNWSENNQWDKCGANK